MAACLGVPLDIIQPAGFDASDRALRRAAMDYAALAEFVRHDDWSAFATAHGQERPRRRLVALTTQGDTLYSNYRFTLDDTILLGRETAGLPETVHAACDARVRIPMVAGARSINVAVAGAMVLGEALRQTDAFPGK